MRGSGSLRMQDDMSRTLESPNAAYRIRELGLAQWEYLQTRAKQPYRTHEKGAFHELYYLNRT